MDLNCVEIMIFPQFGALFFLVGSA